MRKTTENNSRNIPLPVQREVRQRCGFGCVICGLPLYEYEHMKEWAKVKRHVAEEITLLCDQHHSEKTKGLLPKEVVIEANRNPFNLKTNVSKPYNLHYSGKSAAVEIGGNSFTCQDDGYGTSMIPLIIDSTPIVGLILGDGHYLLNLNLFDEFNRPILRIKNNQLYYSTEPWDIQFIGTNLIVRISSQNVLIDIDFITPNKVIINRGRFLYNGIEIFVRKDYIFIANNEGIYKKCHAENCFGGLIIGPQNKPISGFLALPELNRYLKDKNQLAFIEKDNLRKMEELSNRFEQISTIGSKNIGENTQL